MEGGGGEALPAEFTPARYTKGRLDDFVRAFRRDIDHHRGIPPRYPWDHDAQLYLGWTMTLICTCRLVGHFLSSMKMLALFCGLFSLRGWKILRTSALPAGCFLPLPCGFGSTVLT